jgi:hypothetical protein
LALNLYQLQISVSPSTYSINCGNPISLTTNNNSGDPNLVYSWSPTTGLSNPSIANPVVNISSTTIYTVTLSLPSTGCTSANATATVTMNSPPAPDICMVTVDSASQNNIIFWDKINYQSSDTFIIYRDISNNNYQRIGSVPFDSISQFVDTVGSLFAANGDPNVSSWRYKLSVKDSCGNESALSPYHQSLFIQNSGANFIWNQYQIQGQSIPVSSLFNYVVYRDDFSNGSWQPIQTLSASSTAYTDPNFNIFQNIASWRVETNWTISCDPSRGVINTTRSNIRNIVSPVSDGIDELSLSGVSIFPNPTQNNFNIYIKSKEDTKINLEFYDVRGRQIMNTQRMLTSGRNTETFDISSIAAGVYFVQVKVGEKVYRTKLVKED